MARDPHVPIRSNYADLDEAINPIDPDPGTRPTPISDRRLLYYILMELERIGNALEKIQVEGLRVDGHVRTGPSGRCGPP